MMRYQRVSPDCLPFSNGKKLRTTCKEDGVENGKPITSNGFDTSFEGGGKGFRFRSPAKHQEHNNGASTATISPPLSENNHNNNNNNQSHHHHSRVDISPNRGDKLLQWGPKKRPRIPRTEIRTLTDDSSSSSSIHGRQPMKIQRRGSGLIDKLSTSSHMLPPPPPPPLPPSNGGSTSRASNLRNKDSSGFISNRTIEDRSGGRIGSPSTISNGAGNINTNTNARGSVSRSSTGRRSPSSPDKIDKKVPSSLSRKDEKVNGSLTRAASADHHVDSTSVQSGQEPAGAGAGGRGNTNCEVVKEKNVEVIEWPKIYVSLSRKEKEDDFLAMKGTKLPHRPKKRAKNVDRALQYCFPGMWLSDLTKSRYEVREKKSVKKQKKRGLKGMESMESDSE